MKNDLKRLQKMVVDFRDARDWKQFHSPKDMAISMSLEAIEFLELFQWKNEKEIEEYLKSPKAQEVREEIVDVLYWVLLIANDLNVDIDREFVKKMKKNIKKYPVAKARGNHRKYTEL